MSTSKKINISDAFHQHLNQETRKLKLSYKEYLEAAGEFFIARQIDPRNYRAGQTGEVAQLLRSGLDRFFLLLVSQEQHVLKAIHTEASKPALWASYR